MNDSFIILVEKQGSFFLIIRGACLDVCYLSNLLIGQVVHLNAFICLIEDNWAVAACNHGFIALISFNLTHLWMNRANITYLGTPEWPALLNIEIFMAFADFVAVVILILFDVETLLDVGLEVEECRQCIINNV